MRSWRSLANRRFPFRPPDWPATVERPVTPRPVGLDYDHEWSRRYPARLMRAILLDNVTRPLIRLVAPMTLRGVEHLAYLEPPVIFVANHASHLDTPLLLSVLPPRFRHRTVVPHLGRDPDRTRPSEPSLGRDRHCAAPRAMEPDHLPGRRPVTGRLGSGVSGRGRLPRRAQ
jgi:hypothetical protein